MAIRGVIYIFSLIGAAVGSYMWPMVGTVIGAMHGRTVCRKTDIAMITDRKISYCQLQLVICAGHYMVMTITWVYTQ